MSLESLRANLPSISDLKSTIGMAPALPKTYKAALFKEKDGPLTVEEVELKLPEEGQVLVKVLACGVCHSDTFTQMGAYGNPFPRTPGHEIIGDVVALGPGEKKWKVGDRVGGGWHGGHDGTCKSCRRAFHQLCTNAAVNGIHTDGGYAEYCLLRTESVASIPKEVAPADYAPLLCAGVTVFNSMRNMHITAGETVAIQGLGGLGHLAVQYASKMGFRVVALSSSASKEKFAKDLGAHDYIDGSKEDHGEALQKLGGAAMIVVTAPNPKIIGSLTNGLAPLGKLLVLAPVGDIEVNSIALVQKAASVHGWASGHALDSEEAIEFAEVHGVKCMCESFPLKDAPKAYEAMLAGKPRFRAVLVME